MKKEMMLFSERMRFAAALTDFRDTQMQQLGWQVKDKEKLKGYYMDCLSLLVGLEIIDIKKAKEFMKNMGGNGCIS